MSVPTDIMTFRQHRAKELLLMEDVLRRKIDSSINTSAISKAVSQLKDPNFIPALKDGTQSPTFWGYEIEDFQIPVQSLRHIRPEGINKLELTLNMKVIANSSEWMILSDPLLELNFNVVIRGVAKDVHYLCFHLDRHDMSQVGEEPHPIYHLQYVVNPFNTKEFNYGSVLQIDTPRIMHYPMDFILGIGFLTSNFFPFAFDALLDDGTFANLYRHYQERIWKPFIHSLADHWTFDKASIVWKPTSTLCPFLI